MWGDTRFQLPEQCADPARIPYDYSRGMWSEYHRFSSDVIDFMQMELDRDEAKTVYDFIRNNNGTQGVDPTGDILLEPSTFLIPLVAFLICLVAMGVNKMVVKARNGWKASVWKNCSFVSHRFFVFLQICCYLFCLFVIGTAAVFVVLSINQYNDRLQNIDTEHDQRINMIDNKLKELQKQADCVYTKQKSSIDDIHGQLLQKVQTIIEAWRNASGLNDLKKFDYVSLQSSTKGFLERSVDITDRLVSLTTYNASYYSSFREIQAITSVINGVRMQLASLNAQIIEMHPNTLKLVESGQLFEDEAREKLMVPVNQIALGMDNYLKTQKQRIELNARGTNAWFEYAKDIISTSKYYAEENDQWDIYGKFSNFVHAFILVSIIAALVTVLIGLYFSFKLLCRDGKSTESYGAKTRISLYGIFHTMIFLMVLYVAALAVLMVMASPLARTCDNMGGYSTNSFYWGQRPDKDVVDKFLYTPFHGRPESTPFHGRPESYEGLYKSEPNRYQSNSTLDFTDFEQKIDQIRDKINWKIKERSPARIPMKVTLTELRRNVDQLSRMESGSGILPYSRRNSVEVELLAVKISIFALQLKDGLGEVSSLMMCLDKLEAGFYPAQDRYSLYPGSRSDISNTYSWTKFEIEKMIWQLFRINHITGAVELASHTLCTYVRNPFNGIWVTAMFAMPLMFLATLTMLLTIKAVSVPAVEAKINLFGWIDSVKMPVYNVREPLIPNDHTYIDNRMKYEVNTMSMSEEIEGGILNQGMQRSDSDPTIHDM